MLGIERQMIVHAFRSVCDRDFRKLWSQTVPPENLDPEHHESSRAEDDPKRGLRELAARRQPCELRFNEVEIVGDRAVEIGAGLIIGPPAM